MTKDPSKDRTADEKKSMRMVYTPGDEVLPGKGGGSTATPRRVAVLVQRTPVVQFRATVISSPSPTPQIASIRNALAPSNTSLSNPSPATAARGTAAVLRLNYAQLSSAREATCRLCSNCIDYSVRCICTTCKVATCTTCFRANKGCGQSCTDQHIILFQRQYAQFALHAHTVHIEIGLFCSICESSCCGPMEGRDLGGATHSSYFYQCSRCHTSPGEEWGYCMSCVWKGNCCTHELELYVKRGTSAGGSNSGGSLPSAASEIIRQMDDYSQLTRSGAVTDTPAARLQARGYARVTNFSTTCDTCHKDIPSEHSFLHCTECNDGQWDMCMSCYNNHVGRFPVQQDSFDMFRCGSGHPMHLLTEGGTPGARKTILPAPHPPPDVVPRSSGEPMTAIAVKGNWPAPENSTAGSNPLGTTRGTRIWDCGDQLPFPQGAKIHDVRVAFSEGSGTERVEYYWGWYAGLGGLFPGDLVRVQY